MKYFSGSGVTTPAQSKNSGLNLIMKMIIITILKNLFYFLFSFRRLLSSSTFLQLVTWILLIITKLAIYVISFINFPGLFFVPVLIQFFVTLLVLTFTKVSPSFHASAWHDRYITIQSVHCLKLFS